MLAFDLKQSKHVLSTSTPWQVHPWKSSLQLNSPALALSVTSYISRSYPNTQDGKIKKTVGKQTFLIQYIMMDWLSINYIHDCTLREHLKKDVSDPQIGFRPENNEKLLL